MTSGHAPGRRSRGPEPPALPFGAKKETLASAVAEIAPGFRANAKAPDTRVVWLPSVRGQPKYSDQFRRLIQDSGTKVIRLPPMSPNLNAYAERFVRSIKDECLNQMIFIGRASLRRALAEYIDHYHRERNHQSLENRLIHASAVVAANDGAIYRHARLGGTLNFYYRQAA